MFVHGLGELNVLGREHGTRFDMGKAGPASLSRRVQEGMEFGDGDESIVHTETRLTQMMTLCDGDSRHARQWGYATSLAMITTLLFTTVHLQMSSLMAVAIIILRVYDTHHDAGLAVLLVGPSVAVLILKFPLLRVFQSERSNSCWS